MFVYRKWESFCRKLYYLGYISIPACDLIGNKNATTYIVLKHDVETNVKKAYKLAKIEHRYSHRGSFYVQAYLLKNKNNVELLKKIKAMGHEVTYHHDVMDCCGGNLTLAEKEFDKNKSMFENLGFEIKTVCQHGNPVMNRVGYHSNRDFFRSEKIAQKYENIYDIMVNFKRNVTPPYLYISDSGYGWKIVFDPETNDIINSDDKNIPLTSVFDILEILNKGNSVIISTHPHRWQRNKAFAIAKNCAFSLIKSIIKTAIKIPAINRLANKYYYLAKKL